jgi:hypothetical protein
MGDDIALGACSDCGTNTRVFELDILRRLCLACFRDLIDAVIETVYEEHDDAAS